ncbi:hypothetical protein [Candidatus Thiodictyon syntrophicum]|jgi:hypothetical protein|uniref:FlgD Ig-like domain-containing protein n=1 Tax=Candidatus Thiodictyon syntrophicum TaxID=1166950 RepID=A0A2K8U921_9GAMM|nr:hypothetical protein [Candidatus Thiodictyon syntrophicum]AUB82047.1 hypothetical protein THSYN_14570 [Candidatus Thiodictyon syntrophicum]
MSAGFTISLFASLVLSGWMLSAPAPAASQSLPAGDAGQIFGSLSIGKPVFNPAAGEAMDLSLGLKRSGRVTLRVFDAQWREVAVPVQDADLGAGPHKLSWDGHDADAAIVPNEAYFFTVEVVGADGSTEIYDPTAFSGGIESDISEAELDRLQGTFHYRLPGPARVNIRIGLESGPLLLTLVDWEPRTSGQISEYWDGRDRDGLLDLYEHPKRKIIITCFTLPDNSVITIGNADRAVVNDVPASPRALKPDRTIINARSGKESPHYRLSRQLDRSPNLRVEFKSLEEVINGVSVITGRTIVNLDMDERSKRDFVNSKFEIVFFLDGQFLAEEEAGFIPYNWTWDTTQHAPGDHHLTVNLSTVTDQIGVASKRIRIVR